MIVIAVLTVFLLLVAALGQTWFWRAPGPAPWYGGAAFCWGVFGLALFLTWPVLKAGV